MASSIKEVFDTGNFRDNGHKLVDLLADYIDQAKAGRDMPVLRWVNPDEQVEFWKNYSVDSNDLTPFFRDVIDRSIHLLHPRYVGHQLTPTAPVTALAAFLAGVINNGMVGYEMGSVSTAMEKLAVRVFTEALGFGSEGDGFFTSGGTLANLTALLSARKSVAGRNIWEEGNDGKQLTVMVSAEAHYCIDRAARIMGLGSDGVMLIETNSDFQMKVELLEESWQKANQEGREVFAIVGSACTTATGSYDNLEAIAGFAAEKNIWFHVDGAHGGPVIFTEKYRHLVNGIHLADSVVIDCHKMLMTQALTTALLYKRKDQSYHTFQQDAHYLWQKDADPEWFNYGKRTFECTKLMMSLKFFTLVKVHGIEVFGENVTVLYDLARTFADLIRLRSRFELAMEPQSNIVCFRLADPGLTIEVQNQLNAMIRKQILEEGEFYIVQTTLRGKVFLRTTLMNPFTTQEHLVQLLDRIEEVV
ncbi:MAG: pyridoxal-dependent decarboxylase [Bacteroidales bacterium]|nr:pyridoxal-dependent decarboxylase [Bacteroidales bacterium]